MRILEFRYLLMIFVLLGFSVGPVQAETALSDKILEWGGLSRAPKKNVAKEKTEKEKEKKIKEAVAPLEAVAQTLGKKAKEPAKWDWMKNIKKKVEEVFKSLTDWISSSTT